MIARKTLKTVLLVSFSLLMLILMSPATSVAAPSCMEIDIRKQEEGPDSRVFSSGSDVPYEITVTNTGYVDLINVVVTDSMVPSCNRVIGDLAAGEVYTYTCDISDVQQGFTNIVTVQGESDGQIIVDEDPSSVELRASPYWLTIGYEDLLFVEDSDFDYNDWVISMPVDLQGAYLAEDTIELQKITFTMRPQARGARLGHEFHLRFLPGAFASDGIAELTVYDEADNPIKDPELLPFIASGTNDYLINFDRTGEHDCTCEAFGDHDDSRIPLHNFRRTVENDMDLNVPARSYAVLTLEFNTPVLFNLPDYGQHCQGLFFDPYLHVLYGNPDQHYDISISNDDTEHRILCVSDPDWLWPEETKRIDKAYLDVIWLGGYPFFDFSPGWYLNPDRITTCVFDNALCVPFITSETIFLPFLVH